MAHSSGTNLRDVLTKTKTTLLPTSLPKLSTKCHATNALPPTTDKHKEPVHKRISEHERDFRLCTLPDGPTDFASDKSQRPPLYYFLV